MKKIFLLWILLVFGCIQAMATHQRAAEITYKHISGLTYEAKIITYTYTPSPADRPTLDIFWGDGTSSTLVRTQKNALADNITLNVYEYRPEIGDDQPAHL
jgi:hypothetical protein